MINMSKLRVTIAFAIVTFSTGGKLQGQVSPSDQLFLNGNSSYQSGDCYGAVLWLFAFLHADSPRLENDPDFAKQVNSAYAYCDGEMKDTMFQRKQLQAQLNAAQQQIASYQQQLTKANKSQSGEASTEAGLGMAPPRKAPPPPLAVPTDLQQQQRMKMRVQRP